MMQYLFLLGGKDLEMCEVRKILEEKNLDFFDKNLSWGAKLSDYADLINSLDKNITVVGIELKKDLEIGNEYIEIDHHNENDKKPSSIEQIAELLNVKLTRYQKLVAENDKGHIRALKEFNATQQEIEKIRRADRVCQGITEKEEKLAEEDIKNNLEKRDGVTIVKASTNKFAPICDRLYDVDKLIVYTDDELNYYGKWAKELGRDYQKRLGKDIVYYGGSGDGYFGVVQGKLSKELIEKMIDEIIKFGR